MSFAPPSDRAARAAQQLWTHWQEGRTMDALPIDCRPASRAEGYSAQAALPAAAARAVIGWKIAATSRAGQAHIAVDGPLAGRLLAGLTHGDGATLSLDGNRMRVAEPEFVFRLGRTLAPRAAPYALEEVLDAVVSVHPGLELPDSRFTDFTLAGQSQLLADCACAGQFVLGEAIDAGWRTLDLAAHAAWGEVRHPDGTALSREGEGANVLGDPRVALAWLANEVSALGIALEAGQIVTTGTCMAPLPIVPGDSVRADFGRLGRVALRLAGTSGDPGSDRAPPRLSP